MREYIIRKTKLSLWIIITITATGISLTKPAAFASFVSDSSGGGVASEPRRRISSSRSQGKSPRRTDSML